MSNILIDAAFPGGNIVVDRIDGYHAFVHQDLRDTEGDWFYWNCRIRPTEGVDWSGQEIRLTFTGSDVIGARGPAVSEDGGENWRWLSESFTREEGGGPTITYTVPPALSEVRLAFCVPYVAANWRAWLDGLPADEWPSGARITSRTWATLPSGRTFDAWQFIPSAEPLAQLLLTSRHHACEAAGTYTLEGIVNAWCAEDELGEWLRSHLHITAFPFMDVDGVENGDQGKNRRPHDHNRDYGGDLPSDSLYIEVLAIRSFVFGWLMQAQRNIALDIHCPWMRYDSNEEVYFVGVAEPRVHAANARFSAALEQVRQGPLPYSAANDLPYGQGWNVAGNYTNPLANFAARMNSFPKVEFATSLEVPYANAQGAVVTPESARALGRDLAAAFRAYLESPL